MISKPILFASLAATMVLALGAMEHITAEEETKLSNSEKIELILQVQSLEVQIQQTEDEQKREALRAEQQGILQRLHEAASDGQTTQAARGDVSERSNWRDLFNLYGKNKGCDGANELWHYKVDYDGNIGLRVDQSFPSELTSGDSPYCEEHDWESNVYLDIRNIFDETGCHANLEVEPVDKYPLNCVTLGGIYVVSVTADYDGRQTSSWTWFWT
ncbi:MAG: hypothetical protein OXP12_05335 [Thaumarchaeota archaeon]|nr:hypothetical protein [Nitrososphaerota archaeon]